MVFKRKKKKTFNFGDLTNSQIKDLKQMFKFFDMIENFYSQIRKDTKYRKVFRRIHKLKHRIFKG